MNNIIDVIKSIGFTAEFLINKGLLPPGKFEYSFDGDDEFFYKPENGILLMFDLNTRVLKSVDISLAPIDKKDKDVYKGEMPTPFSLSMDMSMVRAELGEPTQVREATKLPVIGMVGGWDIYVNRMNDLYPNTKIVFSYTVTQSVSGITFKVN